MNLVSRSLVRLEDARALLGQVTWLDVRWALGRDDGYEQYLAGHVPGAAYVDLESDLADPPGDRGRHPLPDVERFGAAMRRCGVTPARPVVVYDDAHGTSATRAWWLLRYHGHPDVRVLDGGWSWWVESGLPVETGEAPPSRDSIAIREPFEPDPGHLPVLDAEGAARVAREGLLDDARAPERFRGEVEPVDPVAGHIPGAVNVPSACNLIAPDAGWAGRFKMFDDLAVPYERSALAEDVEVGVYCGSGVTATHDVFALHLLGKEAALYPGSWSGWVTDPDRPVETTDRAVGPGSRSERRPSRP
jgi:thiosulfate/3-mercaptopyruvate sulfurtransferase